MRMCFLIRAPRMGWSYILFVIYANGYIIFLGVPFYQITLKYFGGLVL